MKSQFVISSCGGPGPRASLPYAFTEQGVAMLSSVVRSQRAVRVNIEIMRAFEKTNGGDETRGDTKFRAIQRV